MTINKDDLSRYLSKYLSRYLSKYLSRYLSKYLRNYLRLYAEVVGVSFIHTLCMLLGPSPPSS